MSDVDRTVRLSHDEAALLAGYVVARNAQAWEVEWEDFPYLDEASVDLLNAAIVDLGNHLTRVSQWDQAHKHIDAADLFERVTA